MLFIGRTHTHARRYGDLEEGRNCILLVASSWYFYIRLYYVCVCNTRPSDVMRPAIALYVYKIFLAERSILIISTKFNFLLESLPPYPPCTLILTRSTHTQHACSYTTNPRSGNAYIQI